MARIVFSLMRPCDLRSRAKQIRSEPTDDGETAEMLETAADEIERLQRIIDSRPAINAGAIAKQERPANAADDLESRDCARRPLVHSGKYALCIADESGHKDRRQAGDEIVVTEKMICAGVEIYSNPGRYESYEDVVMRIFCAMLSASR